MSRTLRVEVDTAAVSPARTIAEAARLVPMISLSGRLFNDLMAELGGMEPALRRLHRIAENVNKPIAVNMPTGPETSTTVVIAPRSWTPERLKGWIGGVHETLEAAYGPATLMETPPC